MRSWFFRMPRHVWFNPGWPTFSFGLWLFSFGRERGSRDLGSMTGAGRRYYAHDSRNPEHPKDSWIETYLKWDVEAQCYVVTIRTNDTTDANRIAQLIPLGTYWGLG